MLIIAMLQAAAVLLVISRGQCAPIQMQSITAFIISTPSCDIYNVLRVVQGESDSKPRVAFDGQAFDNHSSKFIIRKYLGRGGYVQLSIHWAADTDFALTAQGMEVTLQHTAGIVGVSNLFQETSGLGGLLSLKSMSTPDSYIYGDEKGSISLGSCWRSPYAQLKICLSNRNCDL